MANAETIAMAAHLLRRAAFAASGGQAEAAAARGLGPTLTSLLDYDPAAVEKLQPPKPGGKPLDLSKLPHLQLWWLDRMVRTSSPLQEVMTLFWHNHFATAIYKVRWPALMQRQNQLFRTNALGSFRTMVQQVTRDPAMLIWLDGTTSHRRAPNENYGRELMERFTIGVGNFTEYDVHAAARAFTGFHTNKAGQVRYNPKDHDNGVKTLLGRTGNWGPDQAIDIILSQPTHPMFMADKLWRFFVGPDPTPAQLQPHADAYRAADYQIKPLVHSILTSADFYAPTVRYGLVRSPAELVAATLRGVAPNRPVTQLAAIRAMDMMGMSLFDPPNVGGWPGGLSGPNWINAGTLMTRFNFAEQVAAVDPQTALVAKERALVNGTTPSQAVAAWTSQLGVSDISASSRKAVVAYVAGAGRLTPRTANEKERGMVQLLLASPEFQLK